MAVWVSPVVQGNNAYTSVCAHVVVFCNYVDTMNSSGLTSPTGQYSIPIEETMQCGKGG